MASMRSLSAIGEGGWWVDVGVFEEQVEIGFRLRFRGCDSLAHHVVGLSANLLRELVGEHAQPPQVSLVAPDALVAFLLLDPREVDVRRRVVRRGVRRGAIAHGLDEGGPFAAARALDRLPGRLVDREYVQPVDAHAGYPVADRLVGE